MNAIAAPQSRQAPKTHAHELLRSMLLIRRFEEQCVQAYMEQKIRGFLHVYVGEEAVGTGVMQAIRAEDTIVATYREHGHALLRGISPGAIMAEMYGKQEGCSRGRGGSMHIFDASTKFYGGNAIVGGGIPLAIGLALADKMRARKALTACFFGDGAVAEGEFHESMNLAALWKLPVLFVCENNLYAMGTRIDHAESVSDLHRKAASYHIESAAVNGMDVEAVEKAAHLGVDYVRAGNGPYFLEAHTYRFHGHSTADPQLYRSKAEVQAWKKRDPITAFAARLRDRGELSDDEFAAMDREVTQIAAGAAAFAEQGTLESPQSLLQYVCKDGAS